MLGASARKTNYRRQRTDELTSQDGSRFVDLAIEIRTVRKSDEGSVLRGTDLPPLVTIAEPIRIGGRYDTRTRTFHGEPERWTVWYVGERQREILLDRDPEKTRTLLYSAEGAGKTFLMSQWLILQVILLATAGESGALGATAPTEKRLGTLIKSVTEMVPTAQAREPRPGAWGTFFANEKELRFCTGHMIQFRATQRASAAAGSPVQGYTWVAAACDEIQDQVEQGAYPDIEARLRGAKTSRVMSSATAKDSSNWRGWRDSLSIDWKIDRLQYTETPFVHDEHWERMQRNMSEREWKRRGLALDVGPERQVYTSWERSENLVPIPQIGAKDVTERVLARFGRNLHMLIGHDPGSLQDVSVMLKAFQIRGEERHRWYVVDELRTKTTTSAEHAKALREHLQSKWSLQYADHDEPKVLLRCDPYGTTDLKTDRSVYLTFKQAGFDIRSAAFKKGKGNGVIPKEAGIEMVNSLLCNANRDRRLFVAVNERKQPCAPLLVESLELSERDEAGKAETQKKSNKGPGGDLSDFPAALRYALWQVERVRGSTGAGMVLV